MKTVWVLVLPLALAGPLGGQTADRWKPSVFPTGISLSGNTGPQAGLGVGYARRADSLARHSMDASLMVAGGYGLRGSWFGTLAFRAPGLWPGWRFVLGGLAQREARFEFVGLGNETLYDPDSASDAQPYFYKARRTRYRAALEGTRAIVAGWSVALAVGVDHTRFDSLPGPSQFLAANGPVVDELDRTARLSVVRDGRNNEYDPRRGLFTELSATVGSGGGGYTRFTSFTKVYVELGPRMTAAFKLGAVRSVGSPPLSARFTFPIWEGSIDVLGGPVSHRGLRSQRLVGRELVFGTMELRRSMFQYGSLVEVLGAAFLDFGRVFEDEDFRLTLDGMKLGPGLGLGVRFRGKSLVHIYAARGPDGVVFSSRTGWVF